MPRPTRRTRRPLTVLCGFALSSLVALSGCTAAPVDEDSSSPAPGAGASTTAALTRQQAIARARDVTMRVEVTTCTDYQSGSGFLVGPRLVVTAAHLLQ